MSHCGNTSSLPPVLAGFEHVYRFRESSGSVVAKLRPGEYYVTAEDEIVATTLGSCVAACVRDSRFGIGGMNHFLLPGLRGDGGDHQSEARYGTYAMEVLINEILARGGTRKRLEVKIFGGGAIVQGLSDIGAQNVGFVRDYLATEGIAVVAEDVRGEHARLVRYEPRSGRVRLKRLTPQRQLAEAELQYLRNISETAKRRSQGDVELF